MVYNLKCDFVYKLLKQNLILLGVPLISETGSTPDLTMRVSDNEYTFIQTTNISPDSMNTSSLQDSPVTYPGTNFGTNNNYEHYKDIYCASDMSQTIPNRSKKCVVNE